MTAKSTPKKTDIAQFEKSMTELESIVERMENSDQSLSAALKDFEKGVALANRCQSALEQAEAQVEILINESGDRQAFAAIE